MKGRGASMGKRVRKAAAVILGAGAAGAALWRAAPGLAGWLGDATWIAARFLALWSLASIPATILIALYFRARARANEALAAEGRRAAFHGELATK